MALGVSLGADSAGRSVAHPSGHGMGKRAFSDSLLSGNIGRVSSRLHGGAGEGRPVLDRPTGQATEMGQEGPKRWSSLSKVSDSVVGRKNQRAVPSYATSKL